MHRQVAREFTAREADPSSVETAGLVGRDDSNQASKPLPTSVKALAGVIVVLGVILIGLAAWKIGKWRRQKMRSRMAASSRVSQYVAEKPRNAIQVSFKDMVTDEKKSFFGLPSLLSRPEPAHAPNKAIKKGTNRYIGGFHTSKPSKTSFALSPSAPPKSAPMIIPTVTIARTPSTKSNKSAKFDLRVDVNARPPVTGHALALQLLTANSAKPQVPSPRTSSQLDSPLKQTPATARPKSLKSTNGKKLPRLMIVTCTFIPSLPDEMLIKVGETLRLIEEYEDEWCLVQRVGKVDLEKGVIPRFCLQERPEIVARPTHKKGGSSAATTFATPITPSTAIRTHI
ncbi:hypothetical protein EIP91_010756 [Steccherinum ochraceum]|uniref:SH3 domain-containing protein n=1 Tax=Steccherinum ochraceum TaxID=92696 RepID=A0A4R0RIQ7_9APHY|nr:hypothetical protein EIP91_010756 [Steccherinum ochraceum]